MASSIIQIGLGLAAVGFTGRYVVRQVPTFLPKFMDALKFNVNLKYYKGGFEPKMTKCEALLILGVNTSVNKIKMREAHRRIMMLNHPDRGGSPLIAAKVNEAKDLLERGKF